MQVRLPHVQSDIPEMREFVSLFNNLVDRLNAIAPMSGGRGIRIAQVPSAGSTIQLDRAALPPQGRWAIIVSSGPSGEADFADNRYWVKWVYFQQTDSDTETTAANPTEEDDTYAKPFTATNLAETSGHLLLPGTVVWVTKIVSGRGRSGAPINQYVFSPGGGGEEGFWAIPSNPMLVAGNQARWSYTLTECTGQWTTTGKAQVKAGGRVVTGYNVVESGNPASGIGVLSGGVTITADDVTNGYTLQPISDTVAVWVRIDNTCNTTGSSSSSSGSTSSSSSADLPPPIYLFAGWNAKADCDTAGVGGT